MWQLVANISPMVASYGSKRRRVDVRLDGDGDSISDQLSRRDER